MIDKGFILSVAGLPRHIQQAADEPWKSVQWFAHAIRRPLPPHITALCPNCTSVFKMWNKKDGYDQPACHIVDMQKHIIAIPGEPDIAIYFGTAPCCNLHLWLWTPRGDDRLVLEQPETSRQTQ
jgi:hypothetical protein